MSDAWWQIPLAVSFPHVVGGSAMIFVRHDVDLSRRMRRPSWCMSEGSLALSWTVYGSMMGYASYIAYRDGGGFSGRAYQPLMLYLGLNVASAFWPVAFFVQKNRALATALVASCVPLASLVATSFYEINNRAGYFLIPVILQFSYETVLNFWIWQNN